MPAIQEVVPGLTIDATLTFDAAERLVALRLSPEPGPSAARPRDPALPRAPAPPTP